MRYTVRDLLEETVAGRIDLILQGMKSGKVHMAKRDSLLNTLSPENKEKFEEFTADIAAETADELQVIYKVAFLDGLWLAHKAF